MLADLAFPSWPLLFAWFLSVGAYMKACKKHNYVGRTHNQRVLGEVLHDAFFKFASKPKLSHLGQKR